VRPFHIFRGKALQNSFSKKFSRSYQKLPSHVQKQAGKAFAYFALNTLHPSLEFKCVDQTEQEYAIRISRGYSALGYMQDDTIQWDWIGPHDEYERRIRNI
jgi:mRNA-degrading endonuclease RelE of RelBE toxin-antitoxin system